MKLTPIDTPHILTAADYIDNHGIPNNYLHNNYWVELPNGQEYPFKYLVRIAYQATAGNQGKWLDFQSNESYREYIEGLGFQMNYYKEQLSSINERELNFYNNLAGGVYRKENLEHRRQGDLLKPFVRKVKYWADHCIVEGFESQGDNKWQWSGHFKPYLWHRILRPYDSGKVYFVFGCHGDGYLYMELNCKRSQYSSGADKPLSQELIHQFDQFLLLSDYEQITIPMEAIKDQGWDSLIQAGHNFIQQYMGLYDKLEKLISHGTGALPSAITNLLTPKPPPTQTRSRIKKQRTYKGRKIDWGKHHRESTKLGDAGEKLVILYEQEKLRKLNLPELAEKVHKKLDGQGYDVLSYNKDKNEIHIEIKTTLGTIEEPFYMSINEVKYSEEYPENYFLYRLYDYNYVKNTATFYILSSADLSGAQKKAISYEVVIRP